MNLIAKMEYEQGFSKLEKVVVQFLLDNKTEATNMNLQQLSDATYVSTSTISRLCKKLGEKNYNDFRAHFAACVRKREYNDINFSRPFSANDTKEDVYLSVSQIYLKTIEDTDKLLDMQSLLDAKVLLKNAKMIDVYGFGDSYLSTLMFEHKLTEINKFVNQKVVPTDQYKQAMYSTKDTVALIVSYSGRSSEIARIVELIKANHGKIIAVTSLNDSCLRRNADVIINMCSKEHSWNKIASFSSKVSADYILDILYSLIVHDNYHRILIDKLSLQQELEGKYESK